jgi:PhzF family phenazine biosynthesis protein
MHSIPIFQVDAFTEQLFGGNPAAVCPLEFWLPDEVLLQIAQENNLAETAFFITQEDSFQLRWFTPEIEMDLCGHATLATAHVIFEHLNYSKPVINFQTASGLLQVERKAELLQMAFPARPPEQSSLPEIIQRGIGAAPKEVLKARDYVLVYESEADVLAIQPDRSILDQINIDPGGIIVTAPGERADFVSRFFTPQAVIFEDPVTGSAHCSLIPYWSKRLGKNHLYAEQLSSRKGILYCENRGEKVLISGRALTYLKGAIYYPV